jgi:hypothetical protein
MPPLFCAGTKKKKTNRLQQKHEFIHSFFSLLHTKVQRRTHDEIRSIPMDGRECDKLVGLGDERGDNLLLFVSSPKVSVHSANDSDHSAAREKNGSQKLSQRASSVCVSVVTYPMATMLGE